MSRTEGFSLPRIPASHSKLIRPSKTWTADPRSRSLHTRSQSEPAYYTSYIGCPRQDVPDYVLRDATTFDETFSKVRSGVGLPRLECGKFNMPLTSLEYDSLHDPHVRHLYLKNRNLRRNLISRGLVTSEMKIVGSEREFREHVRGHEMFERKEILQNLLEEKERKRVKKMTLAKSYIHFPMQLRMNLDKEEKRKQMRKDRLAQLARERDKEEEDLKHLRLLQKESEKQAKLRQIHAAKIEEEKRRQMERQFEEEEFKTKYDAKYKGVHNGLEIAAWHREAEILEHRIQVRKHLGWKVKRGRGGSLGEALQLLEDRKAREGEIIFVEPEETVDDIQPEGTDVNILAQNLDELEKELQAVEKEETLREKEELEERVPLPDPEKDLLQKIMLEVFTRADLNNDGRLSDQEFANILQELNFDLSDGEIRDLLVDVDSRGDGAIDYVSLLPYLRGMLVNIFLKRNEDSQWIPLYSPLSESYVFFEKASGEITTAIPEEWAPKIRDDLFADTMGDIFASGDLNQDGYMDREEFYQLLRSPNVGLAYFTQSQADDLFAYFDANALDGHMTFEEFLPLARAMIQIIYQNSDTSPYPWVELDSPKAGGPFWFNKFTSEVVLYPPGPIKEEEGRETKEKNKAADAALGNPPRERSTLPPIQEAPSDRDTMSGSIAELQNRQEQAPASANPSLERPTSPLPPPATPEVNNRPEEIPNDDGEEKMRSPERKRRRRRRKKTEGEDGKERRRKHRSQRHSRKQMHKEEVEAVEAKNDIEPKEARATVPSLSSEEPPVKTAGENEPKDERVKEKVSRREEMEVQEHVNAEGTEGEGVRSLSLREPNKDAIQEQVKEDTRLLSEESEKDKIEAARENVLEEDVPSEEPVADAIKKIVEDGQNKEEKKEEIDAKTTGIIFEAEETEETTDVSQSEKERTEEPIADIREEIKEDEAENNKKSKRDIETENAKKKVTKSHPSEELITETSMKEKITDEEYKEENPIQSGFTREESKSEKNLADDEKISLGMTSSSSLPRPRPTSAKPPLPLSRSSLSSLSGGANQRKGLQESSQRMIEEKPITDEEKIESRRNSQAELST